MSAGAPIRILCGRYRLVVRDRPLVMGILNVTPDSFSDGGQAFSPRAAVRHALRMARDGADLIDIGGESTRPGATAVSIHEEIRRVIPVIRQLATRLSIPLSVDTTKSAVAEEALAAGAVIVNDVSALAGDRAMASVVARSRAAVILMHRRGTPRTMQRLARYGDVLREVAGSLRESVRRAERAGIARERILIDPGLGFAKTARHNLELLRDLSALRALGLPIVVGPSRKSFIGRVLGTDIVERLAGTLACVSRAMEQGAAIVRVHDVRSTVEFIRMSRAISASTLPRPASARR